MHVRERGADAAVGDVDGDKIFAHAGGHNEAALYEGRAIAEKNSGVRVEFGAIGDEAGITRSRIRGAVVVGRDGIEDADVERLRGAVGRGQGALDAFVIGLRAIDREGDFMVGAPEMEPRGHIDLPRPAAERLLGMLGLARATDFFCIQQILARGPRVLIEAALQGLHARSHTHVTRELALDLDNDAGRAFAETSVGAVEIEIG